MRKLDSLGSLWKLDLDGADRRIEALIRRPPDPVHPASLDYGRRLSAIRDAHAELRRALQTAAGAGDVDRVAFERDFERRLSTLGHDLECLERQVAHARF